MIRIAIQNLGTAQALRTILTQEKVSFSEGVGPGALVFEIDTCQGTLLDTIDQWGAALLEIHRLVTKP